MFDSGHLLNKELRIQQLSMIVELNSCFLQIQIIVKQAVEH